MKLTDKINDLRLCMKGAWRSGQLDVAPPPIFIVGTGRSGTHWLGHILDSHPDLLVSIEQQPMFGWSKSMALDAALIPDLLPKLVQRYQYARAASLPQRYADKSHPNLWFAAELAQQFPGARFVGVSRGAHAVVASMLRHRGVQRSIERWQEFPLPNRFLGISETNRERYAQMNLVQRCTVRWLAHQQQLTHLNRSLGDGFALMSYEALMLDTPDQLAQLQQFLSLEQPFPASRVKASSLDKWRSQLSPTQIAQIDELLAQDEPIDLA